MATFQSFFQSGRAKDLSGPLFNCQVQHSLHVFLSTRARLHLFVLGVYSSVTYLAQVVHKLLVPY